MAASVTFLPVAATAADAAPRESPNPSSNVALRQPRPASGDFTAAVDFSTLTARAVRGNKCELRVNGVLTFDGTLEGDATGTTTAVIFAPCAEATANPPGTFFDLFRFEGAFVGTVHDRPATGDLSYAGITRVGGTIDARIVLATDSLRGVLRADARVAVGGSYGGVLRVR